MLAILSHEDGIRCLPKMSPSSSTSTGSQIATWRRSFACSVGKISPRWEGFVEKVGFEPGVKE